jgi:hypothetical protein
MKKIITLQDVERIERLIQKKCESLPPLDNNDDTYTDAKLSRGIFDLLLDLLADKKEQLTTYPWYYDHTQTPNLPPVKYPYYSPVNDTICPSCKKTYPNYTHMNTTSICPDCVYHKATSIKLSSNTSGE